MTTYFVECFWPGVDEIQLGSTIGRLADAADEPTVDWLGAVLVPADEIVLCVADGPSVEAVCASARRAGLPVERVVACVQISRPDPRFDPKEDACSS